MDVQMNFSWPRHISEVRTRPDRLSIEFKKSYLFMDNVEYERLVQGAHLEMFMEEQYSLEQYERLQKMSSEIDTTIKAITISSIFLNLVAS